VTPTTQQRCTACKVERHPDAFHPADGGRCFACAVGEALSPRETARRRRRAERFVGIAQKELADRIRSKVEELKARQ
jgi:recombinational DNA repair protein (RecF pathway)